MVSDDTHPPVSVNDVAGEFSHLNRHQSVALAVSGGADSLALLYLASSWVQSQDNKPKLTVLTVDHGLRPDSKDDAAFVIERAKEFGVEAVCLTWEGPKPQTNLQDAARQARYRLIYDYCLHHHISAIVTAHHLDDQAETILMRLCRGSGVDGLSAMQTVSRLGELSIVRPLLSISKHRLAATLAAQGLLWREDSSNVDTRFERVRWRKFLNEMASLGLGSENLGVSARRLQRVREALDHLTEQFLKDHAQLRDEGYGVIDFSALGDQPSEIAIRALGRILFAVGGQVWPPRLAKVEALYTELCHRGVGMATLSGCRLECRSNSIVVAREIRKDGLEQIELDPAQTKVWDRRFRVSLSSDFPQRVLLRALGEDGLKHIAVEADERFRHSVQQLPSIVRPSLVSFWEGDVLLCVPAIGYYRAELSQGRKGLSASHIRASFFGFGRSFGGLELE